MRAREWDPSTAPDAEIEAWRQVINEVVAADAPEEPEWQDAMIRENLAVAMPGEQRIAWVVEENGELLGYAGLQLLGYDTPGSAVLDAFTRPSARRRGVGRMLLTEAVRYCAARGRDSLSVEVIGGTPAVPFYEAHGFRCELVEQRNLLELATVDWDNMAEMAKRVTGYHLEYFPGGPPDHLLTSYANAKMVIRSPNGADSTWRPGFEEGRLRDSLSTLQARGLRPYVVFAIHSGSGMVAGLTELVVPAPHPYRADQYDTLVVPGHRGYGLGLAMKARMLLGLRDDEPQLVDVQTWHQHHESEPMLRVNAEIGFRPDREWRDYEADLPTLAARLGLR